MMVKQRLLHSHEVGADLILLDDSEREEKTRLYGLKITGTIGIPLRRKRRENYHLLKRRWKN